MWIVGVWCAVGDDVSHFGSSHSDLIFEPTRHIPKMRETRVAR